MDSSEINAQQEIVPDTIIPHGDLPPLRYRDLPKSISLRRMVGPGVILAGLALGSGEFILWPKITYLSGFVFFWACVVGVTTQFFLNMEITRWTLATGESVITGFCRLSRHWAAVFLLLNILPWMIPAWADGSAHMMGWLFWGDAFQPSEWSMVWMSIGGLVLCGVVLTAGPIVYDTVERIQLVLVLAILVMVTVLAVAVVRPDAIVAQLQGAVSFQMPAADSTSGVTVTVLLGAIAFAGVGGTLNLSQSNYIKDKGFGMGKYIGRITSPITGQQEAISEVGYHFHHTEENMARWKRWWRMANIEHFFSFYVTCLACLVLLTLISYSLFYQSDGVLRPDAGQYKDSMDFVWGEAQLLS
ncbi:MAG: Nramp family divalent metal transporter, partial [Planctomycetales bacterium]